jgi:hypothetical protein
MIVLRLALVSHLLLTVASCASAAPDPRYPAREAGCPVKSFPGEPSTPVDDLGTVAVDCSRRGGGGCEREALDVVCKRGGDVAWGLADNSLTTTRLVVHAGHTRRALARPGERGCAVSAFRDAPPLATENVGTVTALCPVDDSKESCLRELEDEACMLGANVVWQIDGPTREATSEGDKLRMRGRAAHTK